MKVTVQDVMSSTVVVVGKETPFKEIVHLMQEHQVGALPVADADGQAVGIVCESDLLREDPVPEGPAERRHRRMDRQRPAGLVASELMRSPVVAIGPDASLGDAARLMHRNSVDCLVVTERSGKVLGVVARPDLLKVFLRDDVEIAHEIA